MPVEYYNGMVGILKKHQSGEETKAELDQVIKSIPICRLCLGCQNLADRQGIKVHTECWNLYRVVNSQIQE